MDMYPMDIGFWVLPPFTECPSPFVRGLACAHIPTSFLRLFWNVSFHGNVEIAICTRKQSLNLTCLVLLLYNNKSFRRIFLVQTDDCIRAAQLLNSPAFKPFFSQIIIPATCWIKPLHWCTVQKQENKLFEPSVWHRENQMVLDVCSLHLQCKHHVKWYYMHVFF